MHQVKIFECRENEIGELESEINKWLSETGARVINITGNIAPQSVVSHPKSVASPSDVLLVVVYEVPE
ncbi:MAG: hypothetical protein KDB27_36030 [Planctomycetales bacterium]|nr:hypothetical protein [Planctomycetales bacterium]